MAAVLDERQLGEHVDVVLKENSLPVSHDPQNPPITHERPSRGLSRVRVSADSPASETLKRSEGEATGEDERSHAQSRRAIFGRVNPPRSSVARLSPGHPFTFLSYDYVFPEGS